MRFKTNRLLLGKILLLLVMLLGGLTVFGCTGIKNIPEGGSGAAISDGTLFLCPALRQAGGASCACVAPTGEGKLVAVDTSGSRLWEVPFEASKPTGSTLGCAPAPTPAAIYGTPAVEAGLVYVGGYNGKIYAINSASGALRWVYPRQDSLQPIVGGPVVALGKLYFGCSDGKLYALDAATGDKKWEFQTGDKIWSTPAIDGETVYISSFDRKLYALNATDGSKRWEFEVEGAITSTPLAYNNTVYIGSFDRYLYAIDATKGSLKWKFMAENWFWAKSIACNDVIYAPCLDHKIYILDAESGHELVDAVDLGSPISSSPVLADSSIIIASEEGKLYSIDTSNNQKKWDIDLEGKVYAPLCLGDGVIYIHTDDRTLWAVNAQSGATLWSLPLK